MHHARRYWEQAKRNKFAALVVLVALLIVVSSLGRVVPYGFGGATGGPYRESSESFGVSRGFVGDTTGPGAPQIRTGSASLDSENAQGDMDVLQAQATAAGGWVETQNKYESDDTITISATLKIPADQFDAYAQWILTTFEVDDSNFGFYRTDLTLQEDQIEILLDALETYDVLLAKARAQDPTSETIQAIADITQKKLEVAQQLSYYGYSLEQQGLQITYATLYVTATEDKPVEYLPEDVGRDFKLQIKQAIATLVGIAGGLFVVLAQVVKYIVYAFVVVIPAAIAYKYLARFWKRAQKR